MVYDTVYDSMHDSNPRACQNTGVFTNLGLVSSVGYLHLVRRVDVILGSGGNPLQGLGSAARRLRAAREQWDTVRTLYLATDECSDSRMDLDAAAHTAQELAAALVAVFPRVQRLVLKSWSCGPAVDRLVSCVAAQYADRLRALDSDHVIAMPPDAVFRGLRDAEVSYVDRDDCKHIRIDPAELRRLKLPGWPVDHSWAAFSADGDESQDIWFPHLRVLDLSCYREGLTDWTAETKPTGGLHFPALKVLKVVCEDEIPQVLERGVFPARLDLVVVLATPPVFLELSNMALPNARHFRLTPGCNENYDQTDNAAIKRVLDNARSCSKVELALHELSLLWQPETVASASLTHLDVSTRIGVGTAAALIRRLPRLSSLHIRGLGAYDMPPDISVPEPNTYWLVAPISNTLRFVRILFSCNFLKPEPAAFALRYLLLAVPSLSIIKAHGIPGDPIDGFVDAYVDQYPHLARLRISVSRCRRW